MIKKQEWVQWIVIYSLKAIRVRALHELQSAVDTFLWCAVYISPPRHNGVFCQTSQVTAGDSDVVSSEPRVWRNFRAILQNTAKHLVGLIIVDSTCCTVASAVAAFDRWNRCSRLQITCGMCVIW
jgi:hypothetical protein